MQLLVILLHHGTNAILFHNWTVGILFNIISCIIFQFRFFQWSPRTHPTEGSETCPSGCPKSTGHTQSTVCTTKSSDSTKSLPRGHSSSPSPSWTGICGHRTHQHEEDHCSKVNRGKGQWTSSLSCEGCANFIILVNFRQILLSDIVIQYSLILVLISWWH